MRITAFAPASRDETTFETARPGVYLAGTVCGGYQTNRWFIENGRFHGERIVETIAQRMDEFGNRVIE